MHNIKIRLYSGLAAAFLSAFLAPAGLIMAQGNLLITPKRIVFEGQARSFDINLANVGADTAKYTISMVQVRMKEDGGFETITEPDPGQLFADRFIRIFPRSVVLGPNESQSVRVQLTRTGELSPGEYRSHMYFRATPEEVPLGLEEANRDTTTLMVQLIPIFGISIPVIIRVGEYDAKVTLSDLSLEYPSGSLPLLKMTFNRTGSMSVYGDIAVDHVSAQGVTTRIGIANGVAVYTPNAKRRFQLPLGKADQVDMKNGRLKIYYSAPSDVKPARYAEAEIMLK
ncbi:MAG: hypothetical protein MUE74_02920 [Bacteroidales bacterium]|nr:hypothetical protein [Bacteroidales bacterium]